MKTAKSSIYLSVIIPSYNEQENFARGVLDEVADYLSKQSYSWEVILSDDGSTDGTSATLAQFAKQHPGFRVLDNTHAGKGPTVQSGMLAAQGDWRLFTDFDQSTPISEVEKLFAVAKKGYDIVIGSREVEGAKRHREPLHRHLMGKGFNILVQLLAVPGIYDTQCGFKLFSAASAEQLFPKLTVYGRETIQPDAYTGAFDVEVLYLARKAGLRVKEHPIFWQHNATNRVNPILDSIRMLRDILQVRIADLKGKYRA